MSDLGYLLDQVMPLKADGSLPEPITRSEFERRLIEVLYPSRHRVSLDRNGLNWRNVTYIDNALVTGTIYSMSHGFNAIRYSGAKEGRHATGAGSDLIHRTGRNDGPSDMRFSKTPAQHGTRESLIDENGVAHDFRVGEDADRERARTFAARRHQRVEQLKQDMIEAGEYTPA